MVRSPAAVFAWQLFGRHRLPIALLLAYGIGLALAVQRVPSLQAPQPHGMLLALPLLFGLAYLGALFAFPESDLASARPAYPGYMLTLPLPTRDLVFWPMLFGTVTVALAWVGISAGVLRSGGYPAQVGWPAAMVAAMLATLQAICWSPAGVPYLRLGLALLLLPGLAVVGVNAMIRGVSPWALSAGFLGVTGLAYALAVVGLARGRRGEVVEWRPRLPLRPEGAGAPARETPSGLHPLRPWQAQLWYEWRSAGMVLPVVTAVFCALASAPVLWIRDLAPLQPGGVPGTPGELHTNMWLGLMGAILFVPPFLAVILGGGRRADCRSGEWSLHPFYTTRPLSDGALVAAKLRRTALTTLATWGVMLLFSVGWLSSPARAGEDSGPLWLLLLRFCTPITWAHVAVTLAFLMLWTWKCQAQALWADLSGRPAVVFGARLLLHGLTLLGFVLFIRFMSGERSIELRSGPAPEHLSTIMGGAAILKLAAAALAAREGLRRRVLSPAGLAAGLLLWAACVTALGAALVWVSVQPLSPGDPGQRLASEYLFFISEHTGFSRSYRTPYLIWCLTILFVPLTRLLLAPLCLWWNRHR